MPKLSIKELQGLRTHSTGSTTDQAAQQTVLSVFKSVLSRQSMGCHSVSQQLMAAGATDEDVKKICQIMAQTVRQLEAGSWWARKKISPLGMHTCGREFDLQERSGTGTTFYACWRMQTNV